MWAIKNRVLSLVENLFKKKILSLSSLNAVISTNESTRILTSHVIYNPAYPYKFQLKTTYVQVEVKILPLCLYSLKLTP